MFYKWEVSGGAYDKATFDANDEIDVSSNVTIKALWGELGNPVEYQTRQKPLAEAYADLPQELKALYPSVSDLEEALRSALYASGYAPQGDNVVYLDVDLYVKPDGVNWEKATLDNFPTGGTVKAFIEYPNRHQQERQCVLRKPHLPVHLGTPRHDGRKQRGVAGDMHG